MASALKSTVIPTKRKWVKPPSMLPSAPMDVSATVKSKVTASISMRKKKKSESSFMNESSNVMSKKRHALRAGGVE